MLCLAPMPFFAVTALLLALSTLAAFGARAIGLPLPFLIGPLLFTGMLVILLPRQLPPAYHFPQHVRLVFIALIGVTIGGQVTRDLFASPQTLALSAGALTLFVLLAHSLGYAVLRGLGRYDKTTAFYAAAPGGLFEAIAMGEQAGADPAQLTLQQFLRIILVVTLLPIGLSLWYGTPVGSSAGVSFAAPDVSVQDFLLALVAGLSGLALGHVLRFPAKQITGPMAIAGAITLTGLFHFDVPQWLIDVAQVVLGTALGTRFIGLSLRRLVHGMWLTLIAVGGMLILSAGFAVLLMTPMGQPFDVLLISFAPGGVTEMSLVALSLASNPAFVTLHHVFRIVLTVVVLALSAKVFRPRL